MNCKADELECEAEYQARAKTRLSTAVSALWSRKVGAGQFRTHSVISHVRDDLPICIYDTGGLWRRRGGHARLCRCAARGASRQPFFPHPRCPGLYLRSTTQPDCADARAHSVAACAFALPLQLMRHRLNMQNQLRLYPNGVGSTVSALLEEPTDDAERHYARHRLQFALSRALIAARAFLLRQGGTLFLWLLQGRISFRVRSFHRFSASFSCQSVNSPVVFCHRSWYTMGSMIF